MAPSPNAERKLTRLVAETRPNGEVLVYAPDLGVAFWATPAAWSFIVRLAKGTLPQAPSAGELQLLDLLSGYGLFEAAPAAKVVAVDYAPTRLVLLATAACNLRCRYCFSGAGFGDETVSAQAAKAAIDYVLASVIGQDRKKFSMTYLGGGEPTLAWDTLRQTHSYARERCASAQLTFNSSLVTNCVFSTEVRDWIAENINWVTASLDGPQAIMDIQRPSKNGRSVFDQIVRNVSDLVSRGCHVGVRCTVTDLNVGNLVESTQFFAELGIKHVHFEPLTPSPRSIDTGVRAPETSVFLESIWNAYLLGEKRGIRVACSHLRFARNRGKYCTAAERTLCLTPGGLVTSCHRVSDPTNPLWNEFSYGRFVHGADKLHLDSDAIQSLLGRAAVIPPECADCIARDHCTTGCYQHNAITSGGAVNPDRERCKITRELTCRLLEQKLSRP